MALDLSIPGIRGVDSSTAPSGPAAPLAPKVGDGPNFADTLQMAAQSVVGELRSAEQLSMKALSGEADIREVSDAVMNAEQSLQAAIAIRDKIVTAFLEVSRMQI